jgi:hypothetical protein
MGTIDSTTIYRLQYFIRNDVGELAAGDCECAANAAEAVTKASLLSKLKPGVVAFRRSLDVSGRYGPPVKLAEFGDVPEDLSVF